jgi:hypothetical protein
VGCVLVVVVVVGGGVSFTRSLAFFVRRFFAVFLRHQDGPFHG